MQRLPFSKPGRFYRGNLHTHSTRSDGDLTPAEVIAAYKARDYDFIALTDHFLPETYFRPESDAASFITISDTTELRDDEFTTILGAEIHGPSMRNGELWHLVAVGLPVDFPNWTPEEQAVDLAKRAVDAGAFVGIAHPHWNSVSEEDARKVAGFVHTVEIYNHSCFNINRADGDYLLDLLIEEGFHHLSMNAADDAHFKTPLGEVGAAHPEGFGGWVQVKAESLDPDALLAALKAGEFYSSTGVELKNVTIDTEADEIVIETSPVLWIQVTGNGARSARTRGEDITEARFPLEKFREHGFLRVTAVAADGTRAWSNPIFLSEATA